jgi:Tol biopolymer transport system component
VPRFLLAAAVVSVLLVSGARGSPLLLQTRDPAWSPDGTELAFVRSQGATGRIFVVSFTGTSLRAVTPTQPLPRGITWSPDAHSLAYASGGDIWRVDLASRRVTRLTAAPQLGAMQPAWSPDGRWIAYVVFEGCFRCTRIYGIDPEGGNRRLLADSGHRPEWSRDGSLLLTSLPVDLLDVGNGQVRLIAADGSSASWSHDGSEFVYSGNGGLFVSTPTRVSPQLVLPTKRVLGYPAISPQHLRVAFVRSKRVVLFRRYTSVQVVLPRSDSGNDAPVWSFRGQLAFVADGPCGPRSEIDVTRSDGSRQHALVRACA